MSAEQQARRWQVVAVLALSLWLGYVVGQITPGAQAQGTGGVLRVQLDTSNCKSVFGMYDPGGWEREATVDGALELDGLLLPHAAGGGLVGVLSCD